MKDLIIFGTKDLAQLAKFYFERDYERRIVAFTVDSPYRDVDDFEGLPVINFEDVEKVFDPRIHEMFLPITHQKMGRLRESKAREAKQKGFQLATYISPRATYYQTPVGENCFIFENNVIQPFTSIGNNVILWSGNHIGHHSKIGNNVFVTSHVVISGHVNVGDNCFLGVNSTVRDAVSLAEGSLIGMGASISKNTEAYGIYTVDAAKAWQNKRSDEVM